MPESEPRKVLSLSDPITKFDESPTGGNIHEFMTCVDHGNTCPCTKTTTSSIELETEFLETTAAQAVRFMRSDVSDKALVKALVFIRKTIGDSSFLTLDSKQLLIAFELIESQELSNRKSCDHTDKSCLCYEGSDNDEHAFPANEVEATCAHPVEKGEDNLPSCSTREGEKTCENHDEKGNEHTHSNNEQQSSNKTLANGLLNVEQPEHAKTNFPEVKEHTSLVATSSSSQVQNGFSFVKEQSLSANNSELPQASNSVTAVKKHPTREGIMKYKLALAENRRLKRRQFCLQCQTRHVNATLLPCGHFVYCVECAQQMTQCGVCHKEIMGDVKTYLS